MMRTLLLVCVVILASVHPARSQSLAGCWAGEIGGGAAARRAAVEFESAGAGWRGRIHHIDSTVRSDSLREVRIDGERVTFTFPSSPGPGTDAFAGRLDGPRLTGTIRSGGNDLPAGFDRVDLAAPDPALDLIGYWSGGLEQAGAVVLRLGVEIAPAPCGQVIATLDSPDQGASDIPVRRLRVIGDSMTVDVAVIDGTFRGVLDAERSRVDGLWSQGPATLGMSLVRGDSAPGIARPQHPTPPFPYDEVEVAYENPADGTRLAGTLTIPPGDGPFPAVLLLTGSGAQDRDETLMGHKPFLVIADHLTRRGIAVLRVDDRGVGGTTGSVMDATIADNVGDALAGVAYLRSHERIDADRIGLLGHSEGGWVAPAAAVASDDVAFVVLLAGPAAAPDELLLAQSRAVLTAAGDPHVDEQVELTRMMIDRIRAEPDDERAIAALLAAMEEWIASLPPDAAARFRAMWDDPAYQAQLMPTLRSRVTPWFRGLLAHDPLPALEGLDVPVLALFGGLDLQVPADQSTPVLEEIWADHPDATIRVLPGLNHLFQHASTGLITEYARIEETIAPEVLETIADWIAARS